MALSKIDTTNMIEDVPQSKLDNNINFRNIIINGGMDLAQRSTSVSGITSDGYNTIDRMRTACTTMGTWTQSQSTDVPTGQGFAKSLKMDCTTADASPAAGDRIMVRQFIEGQNLQYLKKGTSNAESLTLSFWVKSNKTGTYIAEIYDVDNSRHINKSYTIDSASTWEKKTITFAGDTTGTLNNDNGDSFHFGFWLGAGSSYTSGTLQTSWGPNATSNRAVGQVNLADSTSNEWYITGVQLEAGQTASEFEFLPRAVMESLCQRYFYIITEVGIPTFLRADGQNNRDVYMPYKVTMRANPSITSSAGSISNLGTFSNTYPSTRQLWGRVSHTNDTSTIFIEDDVSFDAEL